ncbi:MAG: fused response regulator/phosphatase [Sulfuricellaceae bacterium]|nr:fused response regulator/phosphatase [Sulfuricellaceae bacterium]
MKSDRIKVLVVDDVRENLVLLRKMLEQEGYHVVVATSGEEALEAYPRERPDVVLMDVMLPGIDGYETTRRLRLLNGHRWIPILFVSALGQSVDMTRGLEAGGDDYISKPIDLALLLAKMRAMQRIAAMQAQLESYRQAAEDEQEMARDLMDRMLESSSIQDPGLHLWIHSACRFCGDLMIANRSIGGHLYVLHADAMGHGLSAALTLLPAAQTFHSMTQQGLSVSSIAHEMNRQLHRQMPVGRFVTATLLRLDRGNRLVEVWNGGNPALIVVSEAGEEIHRFGSDHLPLGPLDADEFDARTRVVQLREPFHLLMFSDGLVDAENEAGKPFGEEGIRKAVASGPDIYANLKMAVQGHIAWGGEQDDISLVLLSS